MGDLSPKIVVIDNYDSFTYNLVHLLHECGHDAVVWRNDQFNVDDIEAFDHILLSPGPGLPAEAGHLMEVIRRYAPTKKILGVCLGLQAIAEVYGGKLTQLPQPVHGSATPLFLKGDGGALFRALPESFLVGRYHSWAVSSEGLPDELLVTAVDGSGTIMALSHRALRVHGVQFHPESVLTEHGRDIIANWLKS